MLKTISDFLEKTGIKITQIIKKDEELIQDFEDNLYMNSNKIMDIYKNQSFFSINNDILDEKHIQREVFDKKITIDKYKAKSTYKKNDIIQNICKKLNISDDIYYYKISKKKADNVLVFLHGFGEETYKYHIKYLFIPLIKKMKNLDILLIELPYHMNRSIKLQNYSGSYFFDSFPLFTIEAIRQSVSEISQFITTYKNLYKKIVLSGFSLGGHIVSYLATCDDRADLYICGYSGTQLDDTIENLELCPGLINKKKRIQENGLNFKLLYQILDLNNYLPAVSDNKVFSIAGLYDKVVTHNKVEEFRKMFDSKYNVDFKSGHLELVLEIPKGIKEIKKVLKKEIFKG